MSCLPQIIYRNGGFFEPSEQLGQLYDAAVGSEDCEFVKELYPPFTISRPLPEYITVQKEPFHEHLVAQCNLFNRDYARGAASAIVVLKNVTLHASVLYTTSKAGFRPVYETYRANDRPYVPIIDGAQAASNSIDLSLPNVLSIFIGSVGSFNYGHFLIDDLPRIKAVEGLAAAANGQRIRILISSFGEQIDRVRVEALLHLSRDTVDLEVALIRIDKVYHFDILYYITPISYHPVLKSPASLGYIADRMATEQESPDTGGTRIFITRRSVRSRSLLNVVDVEEALARYGFQTIDVEALSFIEQARVFGEAQVIVGCMGAAMTNCVFAKPGTWTLYLGPEGWLEPFYWDIASVRGHHYLAIYGEVMESGQPAHLSSYTIKLGDLNEMLARLPPLHGDSLL